MRYGGLPYPLVHISAREGSGVPHIWGSVEDEQPSIIVKSHSRHLSQFHRGIRPVADPLWCCKDMEDDYILSCHLYLLGHPNWDTVGLKKADCDQPSKNQSGVSSS